MTSIKTAMILGAGLGTRMRHLTEERPKPMIEISGKSIINHVIDNFVAHGIEKIVVNSFYKAEMLEEHLSKRSDVEIVFSREEERLETGGGILQALPLLGDDPFFVASSDVILADKQGKKPHLQLLEERWTDDLDTLLLLQPMDNTYGYDGAGDFEMDEDGNLAWRNSERASYVFTSTQIINAKSFARPEVKELGKHFPLAAVYKLFIERTKGVESQSDWYHIGTPEAVEGLEL